MIRVFFRAALNLVLRFGRPLAGAALLLVLALALSLSLASFDAPDTSGGWGAEALVTQSAPAWSPIAAANACGMGASSCFKCHNGTRASAPNSDKQSAPWHPDHSTVNHSCAGCHKGNPRLIKKELAHKDLIKDPRTDSQTCATCHKGGNVAELLKAYQR